MRIYGHDTTRWEAVIVLGVRVVAVAGVIRKGGVQGG